MEYAKLDWGWVDWDDFILGLEWIELGLVKIVFN
jgi:hypothetical protein